MSQVLPAGVIAQPIAVEPACISVPVGALNLLLADLAAHDSQLVKVWMRVYCPNDLVQLLSGGASIRQTVQGSLIPWIADALEPIA